MTKRKPIPDDINARNKEFWDRVKDQVAPLVKDSKLIADVVDAQTQTAARWRGVGGLNSLEADLLSEHARRKDRLALEERAKLGDKGKRTLDQQRENQKKATAVATKYHSEDKAKWQEIADGQDLSGKSKSHKAKVIARRLGLPPEAVSTIRKVID
ncbi:hypothetical protein QYH69_15705 [Paraburkholderia sp. SARCC-3016]|uniref:hypothetical protein n=1 Tax=Paraburkholderia sp. SARCC-3016 TaxID=3058611 RepID=UPI00280A04B2|nr:hypothetical protein [Paraburkholderia sp. SARCC-3016]MDQ7978696.1 hypothetical protein [Paraburkholderia sp. SARCC-3016]